RRRLRRRTVPRAAVGLGARARDAVRQRGGRARGLAAGLRGRDAHRGGGRGADGGTHMSLEYTSLRILELDGRESFETGEQEGMVLPLEGACTVTVDGERFELAGRESVFGALTDFAYAPRDARVEVSGRGRFALPGARARARLKPRYGPADQVPVELRGA